MLLDTKVKVKWNILNKDYYCSLNYNFTKYNDSFVVPINDLNPNSNTYVKYICDECNCKSSNKYYRYLKNNKKYGMDLCYSCICKIRNSNRGKNAKNINDYGYFCVHDNRKQALLEYLQKYHTLNKMTHNAEGKKLYDNFYFHGESIYDVAKELGYTIEDICGNMPNYYYKDYDIYREKIAKFIEEYNRFPTHIEIQKVLRINTARIKECGGIDFFKKLVDYTDEQLIDKKGDYNKSIRELTVANYLYDLGLSKYYLREQYPFSKEEGYYRSDFTLFPLNNKIIHVEVWGYSEKQNCKRANRYTEVKKRKIDLYNKYQDQIILISVDDNVFRNKTYEQMILELDKLFKPLNDLIFLEVA